MENNLYCDLNFVGSFVELSNATVADRSAALALAEQQLEEYRGANNNYFQCERLIANLASDPADDLAAWQTFTGNGETDPRFIDPQFVRPDLVSLSRDKLFPPRAFALKSNSPLRRLKIGCDVSQLPDLPPRLYDLLPANMRPDVIP
jgi:hypothetical protein